jgi:hypothetical protein
MLKQLVHFFANPIVMWVLGILVGMGIGFAAHQISKPTEFVSWQTLLTAITAGVATIFLWYISATEYDPFKAGLTKPILASGAVAFVTVIVWTFLYPLFE